MYTINRINNTGAHEHAEFWVLPGERLIDKLEEVLYILYEEEPLSNRWWWELQGQGYTRLSYHNLEFSMLTYDENRKTFVITED